MVSTKCIDITGDFIYYIILKYHIATFEIANKLYAKIFNGRRTAA